MAEAARGRSRSPAGAPAHQAVAAAATLAPYPAVVKLVLAIVFIDMCCTGMSFVRTPSRVLELGGDVQTVGLLTGFCGALQLVGAPLVGKYTDSGGPGARRRAMVLGLVASCVTAGVSSATGSWVVFFLCRAPSALLAHTLAQAQSTVAALGKRGSSATASFADINSVMGMGLSAGCLAGGLLSFQACMLGGSVGYAAAALLVTLLYPADLAVAAPKPLVPKVGGKTADAVAFSAGASGSAVSSAGGSGPLPCISVTSPTMLMLGATRLLFSLGTVAQRETFGLAAKEVGTSISGVGALLSYKGLVTAFANSAALAPLLRAEKYSESGILLCSVSGQVLSYCAMAAALYTGE
jgi:hypothetical protein